MKVKVPAPMVTADLYNIESYDFQVTVIKVRQSRGRSWASCVTAHVPSRSGGDEHHVKIYRKNPPKCTCLAAQNNRLCWAVKLIALIADDNEFFKS